MERLLQIYTKTESCCTKRLLNLYSHIHFLSEPLSVPPAKLNSAGKRSMHLHFKCCDAASLNTLWSLKSYCKALLHDNQNFNTASFETSTKKKTTCELDSSLQTDFKANTRNQQESVPYNYDTIKQHRMCCKVKDVKNKETFCCCCCCLPMLIHAFSFL